MENHETAQRFLRSAGAAALAQLARVGIVFVLNVTLRRLVPPEDWGLWNWAEALFLVIGALRDLGLPAHTLRLRPRPFGNLLLVEACWGSFLVLLTFVLAPLAEFAYMTPDPRLVTVVRTLALFMFLEGLAAIPLHFFDSELTIRRTLGPEIARNLTNLSVAVTLAVAGYGVWSIVIGQIAASLVFTLLLWYRAWGKIPLYFSRGQTVRLIRDSLPLAMSWFIMIVVMYVDRLILGARFDAVVLGFYGFAYWVSILVSRILLQAVGRALYPALVAYRDDPVRRFEIYRLASLFLMCLEVPAAWAIFVNADLASVLLGGGKYAEAVPFLRVLAFATVIDPFGRFGGELLITRGEENKFSLSLALTALSFTIFGLAFTSHLGAIGMAWANLLPLGAVVMIYNIRHVSPEGFRRMAGNLVRVYLLPLVTFLPIEALHLGAHGPRIGLTVLALLITVAVYGHQFGGDIRRFFRDTSTPVTAS